jgi:hypothetical protein
MHVHAETGWKDYELPAGDETIEFRGKLLGTVDNDGGDRPRWAELRLYKILSGDEDEWAEQWLLYTVGHTLVYHAPGGCNRGIPVAAGDIPGRAEDPDSLEPCVSCRPGGWEGADPDEVFDLEVTWYTYTPCATAQKVLDALRRDPRCQDCGHKHHPAYACSCGCEHYVQERAVLSMPGRRLIEVVKAVDGDIARAAARRVRL